MNAEKMTTALFEKMSAEQDKYRAWLVAQPPEEILNHTSEYTTREDILMAMEFAELTEAQVNALLESPTPLADVYKNWSNMEFNLMDNIVSAIEDRANEVIRQEEELLKSPVYKYPFDYARDNGELEQYRASHQANIACAGTIETAISSHHDGFSFDSKAAVQDVVEKFGYERPLYVLAATVRGKEWDGRFSRQNKEWAHTVPVFEDKTGFGGDRNMAFSVQSHSTLTDAFLATARHEYLLSLPLTKEDIKAEALNILCKFQDAREPNSPNRTHYMAQISPDFLARAKTKDTDRLMSMLPFQSLSLSTLEGRTGTFALITKEENRFQSLQLRKPSVCKKLQQPAPAASKPSKRTSKDRER